MPLTILLIDTDETRAHALEEKLAESGFARVVRAQGPDLAPGEAGEVPPAVGPELDARPEAGGGQPFAIEWKCLPGVLAELRQFPELVGPDRVWRPPLALVQALLEGKLQCRRT